MFYIIVVEVVICIYLNKTHLKTVIMKNCNVLWMLRFWLNTLI